jgi:MFS family permease
MKLPDFIHVINFGRRTALNAFFVLAPLYLLGIGFNGWQIGAVTSLFAFAPLAFSFPVGWINDRFSIKGMIRGALALQGALYLLLSQVRGFLPLAVIFLLLGMGNNALDVSINSYFYKNGEEENPNRKYSRLVFWSNLGTAVGPLLGGALIAWSSFSVMFAVFAGFLALLQVFAGPLRQGRFALVPIRAYGRDLIRKNTVLFSTMIFVIGLHWGVEGTVYSPFLKNNLGLTTLRLSLYVTLALAALALSSLFIGRIPFDLKLNKRLFTVSMLLSGAGLALMVIPLLPVSFAFRVIHEIGDGFLGALVVLFISRLFEKDSIGGSSALLLAVMTTGQMAGALLFSSIGYRFGLIYPFLIAGTLLTLNAGFARFCFRRAEY